MAADIRAHARYVPHPPQKVRLVIDLVRGRSVTEALDLLKFLPNGASRPVAKMLASASSRRRRRRGVGEGLGRPGGLNRSCAALLMLRSSCANERELNSE